LRITKKKLMTKSGKDISFFFPSLKKVDKLPFSQTTSCGTMAVSITGSHCQLNCKHCGGRILQNMTAAETPSALKEAAKRIADKGGRTILVSGGADKEGQVPLLDFIQVIKEIRSELGLKVLVHTGLVSPSLADALAEARIDMALLDIIGDNQTIREIYHLEASVEDYEQSLKLLTDRTVPAAPHVVMGLHFGQIRGEPRALKMIAGYPIKALVLIGFRPIPKTAMAGTVPPSPEEMGDLFGLARSLFPQTPVILGCERPLGLHRRRLESLAIEAGLDGIAYPGDQAVQSAEDLGKRVTYHSECCALIDL
jgi:lipoyl synthase